MAVYRYPTGQTLQSFDAIHCKRVVFDQDRDVLEVELIFVSGSGATARRVGARTETFQPGAAAIAFLVTNFGTLAGSTFYDKVLSALAAPGVARIPAGGSLQAS